MIKNLFSKKTVATLLALAMISGVALQPKRSEAAIMSLATGAVIDSVLNGLFGVSASSFVVSILTPERSKVSDVAMKISQFSFLTLLVLDDSGQQKLVFKPIDSKFAAQAGITSEEQESYNHELDVIQATFDDISAQIAPMNAAERTQASSKLWDEYRSVMSPASYSALKKLTAQMAR
jgi:hypothetical protein